MSDNGDKGTDDTLAAANSETQAASLAAPSTRPRRISFGSDYEGLADVDPKHYVLGQELARGGMGRIVRARDRRLGRTVAIKELLSGQDDTRFEREARITARLQHPSIVAVHEAGRWPSGEPFFAMKLVAGTPLDKKIMATNGFSERLALVSNVIAAADALAYAHSERVIHRDLKPSNVLCGQFGETVVIDWGLAKDLAAGDEPSAPPQRRSDPPRDAVTSGDQTVAGAVMGTPAYMPPEQAEGERVDARADVYALGAMLYHLLAGVPPYEGRDTEDVLRRVRAQPPKPLAERVPEAPLELVAIVGKAMARDPDERFATAEDMATELHRFQTGKLVESHRYTRGELFARWVRMHRAPVLVGTIAFATLAIVATVGITKIVAEGRRADREAAVAQTRTDAATFAAAKLALDTDPSAALMELAKLGANAPEWGPARTIAADAIARGIAHVRTVTGHVEELAFSFDGTRLAGAVRDGEKWSIVMWDGKESHTLQLGDAFQNAVGFAANGDVIHVEHDGEISRWNPASNVDTPIRGGKARHDFPIAHISPTGAWIALFSRDGSVLVAADGSERDLGSYMQGAWSPDGTMLAAFARGDSGRVDLIAPQTGAVTVVGRGIDAYSLATDGKRVWGGTFTGELYDLATRHQRATGHGEGSPVSSLAMLPDEAVVSATTRYQSVSLDDESEAFVGDYTLAITTGDASQVALLHGHTADVTALAVSRTGQIASADLDGNVRVWQRSIVKVRPPDGHTTTFAAMGRNRGELVIAHRGPSLEVLDVMAGRSHTIAAPRQTMAISTDVTETVGDHRIIEHFDGNADLVTDMLRSRDGSRFVTLDKTAHALVWDIGGGVRPILAEDIHHIAMSADGKHIATASSQGIWLWNADTALGKRLDPTQARTLAVSSDGSRIAVATPDGELALFSPENLVWVFAIEREAFNQLAFSPDGRLLVAGGNSGKLRVFDTVMHGMRVFSGHAGTITRLVFDADGTRIASTAKDHTVRVWSLADGTSRELHGHTDDITSIELDGDRLITASVDRTARVWDLRSGDSRPLGRHADTVVYAGAAPNGQLVTIDHDDRHVVYPDDLPSDAAGLRAWLAQWTAGN